MTHKVPSFKPKPGQIDYTNARDEIKEEVGIPKSTIILINMKDLAQKKCVPCEGSTPPLAAEEIQKYLREVPGWEVIENNHKADASHHYGARKIRKEFIFKNFREALAFVNKVGGIAEAEGHHPDIHLVSYKHVLIELWTHAIGGLSENDFILAAKIENL